MRSFRKMHGLGNDFVLLTGEKLPDPQMIRRICDRRTGIGCDQLIGVSAPRTKGADLFMRIYNPDGSESGACGNATRCVAWRFMTEQGREACTVETVSGLLTCRKAGEHLVEVDMGPPGLDWTQIPLDQPRDTLRLDLGIPDLGPATLVSMGNPHAVLFVDKSLDNLPDNYVEDIGSKIEHAPIFPRRTNVEFLYIEAPDRIRMRVWERGTGETMACGTGACAALVAAVRRGVTERRATVSMLGGDLVIEWREEDAHVLMTGPVAEAFTGNWPE